MAITPRTEGLEKNRKMTFGIGLLKGMAVTLKHLFKHNTVIEYPDVKQDLPSRTRGVIALKEENCTVCMLCSRECPDWCIYIDSHKEELPPKREGGRKRKRNVLDRFAIDYALCMYCGICVEVCPYDALFWSREFEYSEYDIRELTHEKERLSDWMSTVLPPPPLEEGAGDEWPEGFTSPTVEATGARPATPTSSAVEARPEQAAVAPKEGTAAPEAARPEESDAPSAGGGAQPGATTTEEGAAARGDAGPAPGIDAEATKEQNEPAKAEAPPGEASRQAAPTEASAEGSGVSVPQVEVPREEAAPVPLEPAEDPDAVYQRVLEEQRAAGSSPQVAEARAKVARVKAERGIKPSPPTPIETEKKVPSAPTKAERGAEPETKPSGAPEAQEPQPDPGPVAPEEDGK